MTRVSLDAEEISGLANGLLRVLESRGVEPPSAVGGLLMAVCRLVSAKESSPEEEMKFVADMMQMADIYLYEGRVH